MPNREPPRDLAWPACFNARDLGGYATADGRRTRWRALIRADNLGHLRPDGQAALVRDGVGTVIDLRSQSEYAFAPPHPFRGRAPGAVPRYVPVPLVDETDEEAARLIDGAPSRDAAYRLIIERCRGQVAAVFGVIADAADGAVVFHCHAGLDRTGLVAALLLDLVGVPAATIAADYALSEARLGAFFEHYRAGIADPVARARFRRLTAPPELMAGVLAVVVERYAGAATYLLDAGASPAHLARVRARLVGD